MSNKRPPDFTKDAKSLIQVMPHERSGHGIDVQVADAQIRQKRTARL